MRILYDTLFSTRLMNEFTVIQCDLYTIYSIYLNRRDRSVRVAKSSYLDYRRARRFFDSTMSTKENNEVAVEKVTENDKASADAKCDIKGIKRPAEVSAVSFPPSYSRPCTYDPRRIVRRRFRRDGESAFVVALRATRLDEQ